MEQDHDHKVSEQDQRMEQDSFLAPSNSDAAETTLAQNLLVAPSSSSAGSNVSQSSCTTASVPLDTNAPVAPSISTDAVNRLSGTATALPLLGPSSSTDGVDLSLGLSQALTAAGSPSLSTDLSLGQPGYSQATNTRSQITIGTWTQVAVNSWSLVARCYFGKQQLVWDIHDVVQTETGTKREWKRMEIEWGDVLSLKADVVTGCLEIELRRPPSFFKESTDLNVSRKWQKIDHFTQNHPSTFCRRHELYFDPDVLKTNYNKIVAHSFWATGGILEVPFPTLPHSPYFTDDNPNLAAHQLLGPQGIPPAQPMNVPSPPQVGPHLGGTSQQNPQEEATKPTRKKETRRRQ